MNCPYQISISLHATGRRKFVYYNGFSPSAAVFTQDEKDRNYRHRQVHENEAYVTTHNRPAGIPQDNLSHNVTTKYQAKEHISFSSAVYPVSYVSASGSSVKVEYDWKTHSPCFGDSFQYVSEVDTYVSTLIDNSPASPHYSREWTEDKTSKSLTWDPDDYAGTCQTITTNSSTTVNDTLGFVELFNNPNNDPPIKLSPSSVKYNATSNGVFNWSGYYTITWLDWITYQSVIDDRAAAIALVNGEAAEDFDCIADTADSVDGEIYGKCGAMTLSNRTFLLSKYEVSFNAGYADKDHNVTGVDVQHLDDVDIVLRIAKDLGKPTQIRVIGDIVELSQDDPVVETVTPFDETLSVGAEDSDQSTSTHHAWKYGKPAAWSAKLSAPIAGGTVLIRNLAVQVEDNSYLE